MGVRGGVGWGVCNYDTTAAISKQNTFRNDVINHDDVCKLYANIAYGVHLNSRRSGVQDKNYTILDDHPCHAS